MQYAVVLSRASSLFVEHERAHGEAQQAARECTESYKLWTHALARSCSLRPLSSSPSPQRSDLGALPLVAHIVASSRRGLAAVRRGGVLRRGGRVLLGWVGGVRDLCERAKEGSGSALIHMRKRGEAEGRMRGGRAADVTLRTRLEGQLKLREERARELTIQMCLLPSGILRRGERQRPPSRPASSSVRLEATTHSGTQNSSKRLLRLTRTHDWLWQFWHGRTSSPSCLSLRAARAGSASARQRGECG